MPEIVNVTLSLLSQIVVTTQLIEHLRTWIILFSLFSSIAYIHMTYDLFEKAGEDGWALFIPVYNFIAYARISGKPYWMFLLVIFCLVATSSPFSESFDPLLRLALILLSLVISIIIYVGFIKQYNGSVIFWICYTFIPILALFFAKKVEYTGGVIAIDNKELYIQAPPSRYPSYSRPVVPISQDPLDTSQKGATDNSNYK
jgi:hypothetical protein